MMRRIMWLRRKTGSACIGDKKNAGAEWTLRLRLLAIEGGSIHVGAGRLGGGGIELGDLHFLG